jgi:flagellar basal body-associated protein FliL
MTGGAVLALIIFIVVLVVAIAAGIFVLCKKKPEDAMIAHNAIYNSLESEEQL